MKKAKNKNSTIELAKSVLTVEAEEILNAKSNINSDFELAVQKILKCDVSINRINYNFIIKLSDSSSSIKVF